MKHENQPEQRVYFRNIKPHEAPETLTELHGPTSGIVKLPHSVFWAPGGGHVDLDKPGGIRLAYRAVLSEGTVDDQVEIINCDQLIKVWPNLTLPRRVRQLWEERFPELQSATANTE